MKIFYWSRALKRLPGSTLTLTLILALALTLTLILILTQYTKVTAHQAKCVCQVALCLWKKIVYRRLELDGVCACARLIMGKRVQSKEKTNQGIKLWNNPLL